MGRSKTELTTSEAEFIALIKQINKNKKKLDTMMKECDAGIKKIKAMIRAIEIYNLRRRINN